MTKEDDIIFGRLKYSKEEREQALFLCNLLRETCMASKYNEKIIYLAIKSLHEGFPTASLAPFFEAD